MAWNRRRLVQVKFLRIQLAKSVTGFSGQTQLQNNRFPPAHTAQR